ncbi:mite group 2 allergen-like Ixo r 2 [Hyalella azteca]|uniref:Mite group 2 allergen-like Ixo r 2 n=1 Tax=Hyalella azteca TaxID=294128 RepID=A0A8B7NLN5_HYAAZ|nr:mite group 2 allergen-like Ixo r 2 [Hyalella azteca]
MHEYKLKQLAVAQTRLRIVASNSDYWKRRFSPISYKMKSTLALLLVALAHAVLATEFQDCGSEALTVALEVESCDIPPCVVTRGDTFPVTILFTVDHDVDTLTAEVTATIGGFEEPWPGFDKNACAYLLDGCPVTAGSVANWTYPVEVLPEYPPITTLATFRLVHDGEVHDEVCLQVPVTIV